MDKKQELNKKLAEWAGFKEFKWAEDETGILAWSDEGKCREWLDFTQSLDACFKWLVPKLQQGKSVDLWLWHPALSEHYSCSLSNHQLSTRKRDGEIDIWETAETPALALCLAIEKLIKGKG